MVLFFFLSWHKKQERKMSEAMDAVPVNFLGLDDAVQRLTRKVLGSESARSGPESMPPFPESRGFVVAFAARVWLARHGACEEIKAAIAVGEFEVCNLDPFFRCVVKIPRSDLAAAAFFDEIVRGGIIRASAGESLERADGRHALIAEKDFDRWLRKLNPRKVARGLFYGWLERQMRDGPKEKTKADYWREANQKFNLSARSFEQDWKACIAKTGSNWDRKGRPRKNPPRKIKAHFSQ
jgi:hypothetical protein